MILGDEQLRHVVGTQEERAVWLSTEAECLTHVGVDEK